METNPTESPAAPGSLFDSLSGWEAASRWNAATFDMMARAWQQWLALVTVVPPRAVLPAPPLRHDEAREPMVAARPVHAFAKDEPRARRGGGSSSKREARPTARGEAQGASAGKAARAKAKPARARG